MKAPDNASYAFDVFVSYARSDNAHKMGGLGDIARFLEELRHIHRQETPDDLRIFFDQDEIQVAADWELKIKAGLRGSCLLLAFVSPAYFASEWCLLEWEYYANQEAHRPLDREGIYPLYIRSSAKFESGEFGHRLERWLADLRQRQYLDFRVYFDQEYDRQTFIEGLKVLDDRLTLARERLRRAAAVPGTVDRHNFSFTGRQQEMRDIHHYLCGGTVGVITAVQGLSGIGKTALAHEYAHTYAGSYAGGRWLLLCEGQDNLHVVVRQLATPLEIEFTELETERSELATCRVFAELNKRTEVARTAGDLDAACLLIFDNVDRVGLFSADQLQFVPKAPWLHLLATTKLSPTDIHLGLSAQWLVLDELPIDDAVRLIERLQPAEQFKSESERSAALEIAKRLGGFTLAVEAVAVFLGVNADVSCEAFLARLTSEGLKASEAVAIDPIVRANILHREKVLSIALEPMLENLDEIERFVLSCSALLPADLVPVTWLYELAHARFPDLNLNAPGHPDRWRRMMRRLLGRRLMRATGEVDRGNAQVLRMHRVVQEVVSRRFAETTEPIRELLSEHAIRRCAWLRQHWTDKAVRWELEPLRALALAWINTPGGRGAIIARNVGVIYHDLGDFEIAEMLLDSSLIQQQQVLGTEHPETLSIAYDLAGLLQARGKYERATELLNSVLAGQVAHAQFGPEHPVTLATVNGLGVSLAGRGDYEEAEKCYRRGLSAVERVCGIDGEETLSFLNNLGALLVRTGRYREAVPVCRRAMEGRERLLGSEHPATLATAKLLAILYQKVGNNQSSEALLRRTLTALEGIFGPRHPQTLSCMNDLAILLEGTNPTAAQLLFEQALEPCEQVLGLEHPQTISIRLNLAHRLWMQNEHSKAEPLARLSLDISERTLGPKNPQTVECLMALGSILNGKSQHKEAQQLLSRALAVSDQVYGPDHPTTISIVNGLACSLLRQGDTEASVLLFQRAIAAANRTYGPNHEMTGTLRENLAAAAVPREALAPAAEKVINPGQCNECRGKYLVYRCKNCAGYFCNTCVTKAKISASYHQSAESVRKSGFVRGVLGTFLRNVGGVCPQCGSTYLEKLTGMR